jgi:hypothetical protein
LSKREQAEPFRGSSSSYAVQEAFPTPGLASLILNSIHTCKNPQNRVSHTIHSSVVHSLLPGGITGEDSLAFQDLPLLSAGFIEHISDWRPTNLFPFLYNN